MYGPLDDGGVPEECPFPQGAPRGAPVHVCDVGPCVHVVRDSAGGDVGWCPQRCCSEGNRGLGLVLFCAGGGGGCGGLVLFVVMLSWVVCVLGVFWMTGGFCVGEGVVVGGGGLLVFCVGIRLCVGWQLVHTQYGGRCCLFDIPAHSTVWWIHDLLQLRPSKTQKTHAPQALTAYPTST